MKRKLRNAHAKLSELLRAGDLKDLAFNSCFVDPEREVLCVGIERDAQASLETLHRQLEAVLGVDVDVAYASMTRHSCPDKTSECDPIWGGLQMEGGAASAGTVCLVTEDDRRNVGFLVSSHVVGAGVGGTIGQPSTAKRTIGTVTHNPRLDGRQSDSAFARRSTTRIAAAAHKIWRNGTPEAYDVTAFETSDKTPAGTPVAMQGATQADVSRGQIWWLGVTTKDRLGTLHQQVLASYTSHDGDSGGPVFSDLGTGSDVTFYGINVGTYTYRDQQYGWYSPTEGIRSDLGIPLR